MYAIVDIESNGGPYREECITEIAIYRFDGHRIVDQFISLVNPENTITPYVQKLTGITEKMVKTAPKFHELARRIIEITDEATIVGHNVKFDFRMIRQSFHRLGYEYTRPTIDTITLAKKLIPNEPSYSLGKLCKSLSIPVSDRHRASGDARATVELFKILLAKDQDKSVFQQVKEQSKSNPLHRKILNLIEYLPSKSGLIYLQDASGKILHCNYVDDIFQYARKNLNQPKWKKIAENTTQINYDFTGNTLIGKLILQEKNKKKAATLRYALYFKNNEYTVEKRQKGRTPILKFQSLSQGKKVLKHLKTLEDFQQNPEALRHFLSLENRREIWIGEGRETGEKSFLTIENAQITGYGFYKFYKQIETLDKINKLKVEINRCNSEIINELQLSLLRENFELKKLPKK